MLVVKWPTSNQPDPGGKEQKRSKQLCPTEAYWVSNLTLLYSQDLVCRGRTCRAATDLSASPCPPASAACAYSHSGLRRYAYRQSTLGILAPVAHSLREGSVVIQGLQFLSCFCLMSTAPNQGKCTLLLLHGPGNYQIQMLPTGACPLQLAVGSYPLSFPVYRNW